MVVEGDGQLAPLIVISEVDFSAMAVLSFFINSVGWFGTVFLAVPFIEKIDEEFYNKSLSKKAQSVIIYVLESHAFRINGRIVKIIFGEKHFSWKAIRRCACASGVFLFLIVSFFQFALPIVNKELWVIIKNYDRKVATLSAALLLVALLSDYISIGKSRLLIRLLMDRRYQFLLGLPYVLLDVVLSAIIPILLFALACGLISVMGYTPGVLTRLPDGIHAAVLTPLQSFRFGVSAQLSDSLQFIENIIESSRKGQFTATFMRIPVSVPENDMGNYYSWKENMPINTLVFPFAYYFYTSFIIPMMIIPLYVLNALTVTWSQLLKLIGEALNNKIAVQILKAHPIWIVWGGLCLGTALIFFVAQLAAA